MISRIFESEAVGFDGDNFLNLVAEAETYLSLGELIDSLKNLEIQLGRKKGAEKFSSRVIDIDILLYDERVCDQPIVLPRPEIRDNAYVLWPLSELAKDLVEPGGKHTYGQLWQNFDQRKQSLHPFDYFLLPLLVDFYSFRISRLCLNIITPTTVNIDSVAGGVMGLEC